MNALNEKQENVLRTIRSRRVHIDQVDGRVLRALRNRGLVTVSADDVVVITSEGETALVPHRQTKRRGRRPKVEKAPAHGRAQSIRRAVQVLEESIPNGAELAVGNIFAGADDVIAGLIKFASNLERA